MSNNIKNFTPRNLTVEHFIVSNLTWQRVSIGVFTKTCYNTVTTPCASAFDMVGVYNERVQQDTLRQGSSYQAYTHN